MYSMCLLFKSCVINNVTGNVWYEITMPISTDNIDRLIKSGIYTKHFSNFLFKGDILCNIHFFSVLVYMFAYPECLPTP